MTEEIGLKEKEIELLLAVAERDKKDKNTPPSDSLDQESESRLSHLIESPFFKAYNLDEKDIKIIAVLFKSLFDSKDGLKTTEVLKAIDLNTHAAFLELKRVIRLKDLGILEPTGGHYDDNVELLRSSIRLSSSFIGKLYQPDNDSSQNNLEPYKDNFEYLAEQFERIRILKEISGHNEKNFRTSTVKEKEDNIETLEKRIQERLDLTDRVFPFEEFKRKKNLSRIEELAILALLEKEVVYDKHYEIEDLIHFVSTTPYEKLLNKGLFKEEGRLIRDNIVEIRSIRGLFLEEKHIEINKSLKAKLLGEKKRRSRLKLKNDFFEIIKPSISLDNVILHPNTHEKLNLAIETIHGETLHTLREWGIHENKADKKNNQPVTLLFYGPPGTGKTLTAHSIAYTLERELLTLDCSKILSKWAGESEQNTRKLFDRYRELSKNFKNHPVLLLNEADQFLHRRINAERSTDHMYNQMQNIFLEQLERFDGILIATTNLVDNLDPAFSRRFHHKIEFRRPGPEERMKLWQVHIPEKIPLSKNIDLKLLADNYDLSGGQISTIIRNAVTRAAMRGDMLCQEDLISACEDEISGNFDEKARGHIGFKN